MFTTIENVTGEFKLALRRLGREWAFMAWRPARRGTRFRLPASCKTNSTG